MRPVVIAAAVLALSTSAFAQGRSRTVDVPIKFQAGSPCWKFAGRGTDFSGVFRAGQKVTMTASGDFHMSDGKKNWTEHQPWQISVEGPGNFFETAEKDGRFVVTLPANGKYTFSIGPNAVRGNKGEIEVCTN